MRILVLGAGGVGAAVAPIAARRGFFERLVLADLDGSRAQAAAARVGDERFAGVELDASDPAAGRRRATNLHHVVDNEESMGRDGTQAVVWQTAINPVVALELLAEGVWKGAGVLGPKAFDAVPFLDLPADYGSPHGVEERDPEHPLA
jgi:saccharopine dehydrogenase-like NADP-dependent oxidoreductase